MNNGNIKKLTIGDCIASIRQAIDKGNSNDAYLHLNHTKIQISLIGDNLTNIVK
jgi:hypothetical protein